MSSRWKQIEKCLDIGDENIENLAHKIYYWKTQYKYMSIKI